MNLRQDAQLNQTLSEYKFEDVLLARLFKLALSRNDEEARVEELARSREERQ